MIHGNRYPEISVTDFMSKYLPHHEVFDQTKHDTTIDLTVFDVKQGKKAEKACYPVLCEFINRASGKDGHFICKDVSDWPDPSLMAEAKMRSVESCEDGEFFTSEGSPPHTSSSDFRRIDVAMYRTRAEDGKPCGKPWEDKELKAKGRSKHAARNSVAHTTICGEVKLEGIGYERDDAGNLPQTQVGIDVRGQLCDYAAEILIRQHRTFLFTFSVYRTTAYLMRWDRLGVTISEPIDLKEGAEQFYEFFFRLRKATDVELGLDPTAIIINVDDIDEDADTGCDLHPSIVAVTKAIDALPDAAARVKPHISRAFNEGSWPYYELRVPDKTEPAKMRRFLVRNLATYSNSPVGRSTKGYIAFDLDTQKFRFLKDSWRTDSPGVHPEMEVYEKLSSASPRIPHIASVCCGGDLPDHLGVKQVTRTQEHVPVYHPRIHTRIVLNEVGIPLKEYINSRELCSVVTDAFIAHAGAWKCSKVLHRDVSDGNIVIYIDYDTPDADGSARGLLIDWDLCKYQHELNGGNAQHSRSGTWRFLSAALLNFPLKPHELADDIEAFYHLLCLHAYRFHSHKMDAIDIGIIVDSVYDTCKIDQGYWLGSVVKYVNMETGVHPKMHGPFGQILEQIAKIVKEHYAALGDVLEQYAIPRPVIPLAKQASGSTHKIHLSQNNTKARRDIAAAFIDPHESPEDNVPPPPPPARPLLATHSALFSILSKNVLDDETGPWAANDKLEDKFALINWSPFVRSKRRWDMGGGSGASKRTKTHESQSPGRVGPLVWPTIAEVDNFCMLGRLSMRIFTVYCI
ncbi:hypothetical protein BXZ70DRAFT_205562 [Cristinia sonorae]|uniref:Fungal-type protein kinase domain-containing protein n=1 Tax=Cristinia sonorae TaxID=1940300 RepID=A0A8K0UNE5_9AGAR|nr:hypothetical protein BXZ70DRAFT_205562 [Cristinia sonorae]